MALGLTFIVAISPLAEWNMDMEFPNFLKGVESWAREAEDKAAELTKAMTSFASVGDLVIGINRNCFTPGHRRRVSFPGIVSK